MSGRVMFLVSTNQPSAFQIQTTAPHSQSTCFYSLEMMIVESADTPYIYPYSFVALSEKLAILEKYQGVPVSRLPTPSAIIDGQKFKHNSQKMLETALLLGANFRAHIKTHKTREGVALQMGHGAPESKKSNRIVVLTLLEAWYMIPLVNSGILKDILFGFPIVRSKISQVFSLSQRIPHLRLMIDNVDQLHELVSFNEHTENKRPWLIFIKIDVDTSRAGVQNALDELNQLLNYILSDRNSCLHFNLYGFYCHAGSLYGSKSLEDAKKQLVLEISAANEAACAAKKLDPSLDLVILVGATPTAHAARSFTPQVLEELFPDGLNGQLELHAGNYSCCDLQQYSTGCVALDNISISIIAEVVSHYPSRGNFDPGEALINAGVLALSRETGPISGFGIIVDPQEYGEWKVARLSQEHGIIVPSLESNNASFIPIGTKVTILPQHACITAACYPWYFIVENGVVVDVWVPTRGW